jgi:hypothetical protein
MTPQTRRLPQTAAFQNTAISLPPEDQFQHPTIPGFTVSQITVYPPSTNPQNQLRTPAHFQFSGTRTTRLLRRSSFETDPANYFNSTLPDTLRNASPTVRALTEHELHHYNTTPPSLRSMPTASLQLGPKSSPTARRTR